MPVSSAYSSERYRHMLPRIEIVPRLCLSTFGFHVVINAQSSRFFKLPILYEQIEKNKRKDLYGFNLPNILPKFVVICLIPYNLVLLSYCI